MIFTFPVLDWKYAFWKNWYETLLCSAQQNTFLVTNTE